MFQFIQFFADCFQLWTQGLEFLIRGGPDFIQEIPHLRPKFAQLSFHSFSVGLIVGHVPSITKLA